MTIFYVIKGIDIAYITNGYVYHTTRDIPEAITPGSAQRAGENLLGMLIQLSQSPLVADPSGDQHGAMVFYDFLGLYLVLYPQRIGWILNSLVATVTFVCIALKFSKKPAEDDHGHGKGKQMETGKSISLVVLVTNYSLQYKVGHTEVALFSPGFIYFVKLRMLVLMAMQKRLEP